MNAKTVLILGAGASVDCDFPNGNGLIDRIINNSRKTGFLEAVKRIVYNNYESILQGNQYPMPIELKQGGKEAILKVSNDKIAEWMSDLHHFESIDQFIFYRKDFSTVARIVTFLTLSEFEKESFFDHQNLSKNPAVNFYGVRRIWYHSLWNNIISSSPDFDQLKGILSEIRFITFNYDRSLEFYLLKSIRALFEMADFKSSDLPITHVYGKLGSLDEPDLNYNPYQPINFSQIRLPAEINSRADTLQKYWYGSDGHNAVIFNQLDKKLFKLAMGIETYGSVYDSDKADAIQEEILNAKNVYIFGFSFQKQNLDILFRPSQTFLSGSRPPATNSKPAVGTVDATNFKLADYKAEEMRDKLRNYFSFVSPDSMTPARKSLTIEEYFKNHSIKI